MPSDVYCEESEARILRDCRIDTYSDSATSVTYAVHTPTGLRVKHPVALLARRELVRLVLDNEHRQGIGA